MEDYRKNPPAVLAGADVTQLLDYEKQTGKNLKTGESWKIELPQSNVLQFLLGDGTKISARPSGTEPKIKFYFTVNTKINNTTEFEGAWNQLDNKIRQIIKDMKL